MLSPAVNVGLLAVPPTVDVPLWTTQPLTGTVAARVDAAPAMKVTTMTASPALRHFAFIRCSSEARIMRKKCPRSPRRA
jgi:hypothetical protein